jgi:hypothetical protein
MRKISSGAAVASDASLLRTLQRDYRIVLVANTIVETPRLQLFARVSFEKLLANKVEYEVLRPESRSLTSTLDEQDKRRDDFFLKGAMVCQSRAMPFADTRSRKW